MIKNDSPSLALEYFDRAYKMHLNGKIESAIKEYKTSIQIFPTAKAYAFLGWAYSLQGNFDQAIEECRKAIELEPEYGNPYNDMGTYLISLNKPEEALYWIEKALEIPDNNSRYISFYNAGKIYEKKGDWFQSIKFFKKSVLLNPDYEPAQNALIRLSTLLN